MYKAAREGAYALPEEAGDWHVQVVEEYHYDFTTIVIKVGCLGEWVDCFISGQSWVHTTDIYERPFFICDEEYNKQTDKLVQFQNQDEDVFFEAWEGAYEDVEFHGTVVRREDGFYIDYYMRPCNKKADKNELPDGSLKIYCFKDRKPTQNVYGA